MRGQRTRRGQTVLLTGMNPGLGAVLVCVLGVAGRCLGVVGTVLLGLVSPGPARCPRAQNPFVFQTDCTARESCSS